MRELAGLWSLAPYGSALYPTDLGQLLNIRAKIYVSLTIIIIFIVVNINIIINIHINIYIFNINSLLLLLINQLENDSLIKKF